MPRLKLLCVPLLFAAISTSAFAQEETDDAGRQIKYKERTEIDFEGVDVNGEMIKPTGALLIDVQRKKFNPLIWRREDFKTEMKQSVDEVK